ncbi:hypothetical protein G5V59_17090 [Nocardioides sp. W3-2-3]|nr:hypothetical protein [Nocardioides convexus]
MKHAVGAMTVAAVLAAVGVLGAHDVGTKDSPHVVAGEGNWVVPPAAPRG